MTAPLTSVFAGMVFRGPRAKSLAQRILLYFWDQKTQPGRWFHDGFTVDELEIHTGRSHQSVSARVNELRGSGWIVARGDGRATRSGHTADIYRLTQQAIDLLSQASREEPHADR